MKLYITEAGYTTATTPFRNVKVTCAQQKLYLKQIFALPDVKSPRVAAVVWFNLQDNPNWPGGLLTAAGVKKPAYNAFVAIAQGRSRRRSARRSSVADRSSTTA